jgi:hypothetical protein
MWVVMPIMRANSADDGDRTGTAGTAGRHR